MRNGDDHRPGLFIVTDLDGTMLDTSTYSAARARPVIERLGRLGIPLVPCTSKSRPEIDALMARLGLSGPFICENGGAVYVPTTDVDAYPASGGSGVRRIALGYSYDVVVATLRDTAARSGVPIRGFADMSVAEVARECGLPVLDAQLAKLREFDEPFRILSPDPDACRRLLRALRRAGLGVLQGGRFYHAVGGTDKGAAVEALRRLVARRRPALLAGLGDAPNDAAMLRAVDVPVIIRSGDDTLTAWLRDRVPGAVVTDEPGPAGWAHEVSRLLDTWEAGGWRAFAGGGHR